MVVNEDHGGRCVFDRGTEDFARMDEAGVERADLT